MNKSFSLIELLIIVGIMAILLTVVGLGFRIFQKESDLDIAAEEIVSNLRIAQSKTLSSEGAGQYGIYFDNTVVPHQYTLFKGASYASRDVSFDEIYKLPQVVEISDLNLGGGKETVFNRLSGEASPAGSLTLRLISEPAKIKTIYIDSSGLVDLTSFSAPAGGRISDSRHSHFNLGWSIQNAQILKFYFPGVPQTKTVEMANYFNFDKTEFDWSGSFTVSGVEQIFRIHTHSLDNFNTLLCVHRDRNNGKTNQETIIYINDNGLDKEISHYLADLSDNVNVGGFGGIMEIQ